MASTVDSSPDSERPWEIGRDWLEEGEEWFCQEHWQIKAVGLQPGCTQFCQYCPDGQRIMDAQPSAFADESGAQALFFKGVAYSFNPTNSIPTAWTNAATIIGDDQSISYRATGKSTSTVPYGLVLRMIPTSNYDFSNKYIWFKAGKIYSGSDTKVYGIDDSTTISFSPMAYDSMTTLSSRTMLRVDSPMFYAMYSGQNASVNTGNTLYLGSYLYSSNIADFYFSSFYISDEPYSGTGSGPVTPPEPPKPGVDEEDGWLGGLIKSIIEGINKIIDGISAISSGIVNLPNLIADALRSMFTAVQNAITRIGDAITGAVVDLGNFLIDGLKTLFIPKDGYFESVSSDLSTWFQDRFGLLVYPFTLVADIAQRVAALNVGEPSAHIPELQLMGEVLLAEQDVNVYDAVGRNEVFLQVHQLYLTVADGIIASALVMLAWRKFDEITGG